MKIKESEIKAVIADLTKHLEADFQEATARLAKADDEEKQPEAAPEAELSDDSASAPASEAAPEAPAMDAAPEAAPEAPAADPAQDDAPASVESLQAEYAQLAPEELEMHFQALMAAKNAMQPAAPAAPAAAPEAPPALKAEEPEAKEESEASMEKSSKITELEDLLKAQAAEMESVKAAYKRDMDSMAKAVQMVLEKPVRKAVTGISFLNKSETTESTNLTAAEAKAQLTSLLPAMQKAERDVAVDFFLGKAAVEMVAPIIQKYKK